MPPPYTSSVHRSLYGLFFRIQIFYIRIWITIFRVFIFYIYFNPEMEVTVIFGRKSRDFVSCRVTFMSFFSRLYIFRSIGLWISWAHKTTAYDTKMLLKVILILNKTLMAHIQNNQKSTGKSIPAFGF